MKGLKLKYFVLKPKGEDEYSKASRKAMRAYANSIEHFDKELANELRKWADQEAIKFMEKKEFLENQKFSLFSDNEDFNKIKAKFENEEIKNLEELEKSHLLTIIKRLTEKKIII